MTIFQIKIFQKNLEILRKIANLSKSDFSEILGVKNVYRKDYNSIGPKLLMGIQAHFNGVDENWLLTDHSNDKIDITLKKQNSYRQNLEQTIEKTSLSQVEMDLIEALREMNPINRIGLYSTAINLINDEAREREIKKNQRKKEIFEKATKTLAKAIHES
ncbi:MAG: hypothetical protein JW882_13445 [Deltaproteobacteria bacterium]|nr:hypothetical protein [Deltaproteobacteria bacterium]